MKKIRAAIVGYGNIGRYTLQALEAAPDFEVAGIVRRKGAEDCPEELKKYDVVKNIRELKDVDVAVLATPTRKVEEYAKDILALGINTVDSFDIHTQIVDLRRSLDAVRVRVPSTWARFSIVNPFSRKYTSSLWSAGIAGV